MVASVVRAVKLHSKVAFLTGTSPNICGGIALGMADAGARIVCVDVQERTTPTDAPTRSRSAGAKRSESCAT